MQRWMIFTGFDYGLEVEEYVGFTVSGAAYALNPPGRRTRAARHIRNNAAASARRRRDGRIGKQVVTGPLV